MGFRRAGKLFSAWKQSRELDHVLTDRPFLVIVLAVDVGGQAAAERGLHCARDDRRPPAFRLDALPELFKRDPGLAAHPARRRIPFEDLVHARKIDHDPATVECRVIIASACAAGGDC